MGESVKDQIAKILTEYVGEEEEKIAKITQEVAKETAEQLRKTSPRSKRAGKHYADGWKVHSPKASTRRSITSIVYNATKPQLTHLLAYPHDVVNQYGEWGRSEPDPHLKDAETFGNDLYLKRLEEEL